MHAAKQKGEAILAVLGLLAVAMFLCGCVTVSEVFLADGSKGHNIGCGGAVQNISACIQKAGEICGSAGYTVVNREGESAPFSTAFASASANQQNAQGAYVAQSGRIVTRNLFVKCNHKTP